MAQNATVNLLKPANKPSCKRGPPGSSSPCPCFSSLHSPISDFKRWVSGPRTILLPKSVNSASASCLYVWLYPALSLSSSSNLCWLETKLTQNWKTLRLSLLNQHLQQRRKPKKLLLLLQRLLAIKSQKKFLKPRQLKSNSFKNSTSTRVCDSHDLLEVLNLKYT